MASKHITGVRVALENQAAGYANVDSTSGLPSVSGLTFAALELDVDERIVEGMLGHAYSGFAQVTRKHYLAKARIEKLRAVANAMESGFSAVAQKKKLSRLVTFVGLSVLED